MERQQETWSGDTPEAWVGAEGAVGLGPTHTARWRHLNARTKKPRAPVYVGAAFLSGIALGAVLCRFITAYGRGDIRVNVGCRGGSSIDTQD